MPFLYISESPIGLQKVKARPDTKAGRAIAAHAEAVEAVNAARETLDNLAEDAPKRTREAAEKRFAEAMAALDTAAIRAKSAYKFTPAEGVKIARYNVSDETLTAWLAESDPEARAALLAKAEPTYTESPIAPSIAAHAGYRAMLLDRVPEGARASEHALSELASGVLVLPSTGRGPSAKSEKKSAEERAREAAEEMFADAESEDTEAAA